VLPCVKFAEDEVVTRTAKMCVRKSANYGINYMFLHMIQSCVVNIEKVYIVGESYSVST